MQNRNSPQMSRNPQDFTMAGVLQNAGTTLPSLRLTSKRKTSSTTRPYFVRQLEGVGVWAGAQPGRSNGAGPWAWKSLGQAGINPPLLQKLQPDAKLIVSTAFHSSPKNTNTGILTVVSSPLGAPCFYLGLDFLWYHTSMPLFYDIV